MKNAKTLAAVISGLLALAIQGQAETMFQVTIKGTVQTTNGSGEIVSQKLNNKAYIQDAATALGSSNLNSLNLVYVQNASSDPTATGDFLEVITGTNDTPVYTNLQFMYGGIFPPPVTNSSGMMYVAGAMVLPLPLAGSGDTLGGATIDARTIAKKPMIMGTFNYVSLRSPSATSNDVVRIYSGSFNVGRQISP